MKKGSTIDSRNNLEKSQGYYDQFSSVTQLWPTLCNAIDYSTPDFPVHHQLLELAHLYGKVTAGGEVLSENRYFFAPYGKLALKPATVSCEVEELSDTAYELTLSADSFVWMLHLATPDGVEVSDNDFDLLPGTVVKVVVSTDAGVSYKLELYSLNSGMVVNAIEK